MTTYTVTVSVELIPNQGHHKDVEIEADDPLEAARLALSTTPGAYFVWAVNWDKNMIVQPFAPR